MAIVDLLMPKMGESIMEATILKWNKQPGDSIQQDESLLDIATDKVDSEVPSTAAGILKETLFPENAVVPVGTVIARIETEVHAPAAERSAPTAPEPAVTRQASSVIEEPDYRQQPAVYEEPSTVPARRDQPSTVNGQRSAANENRFYSPLVLNIASNEGIHLSELEKIPGTGNEGRVTKKDILQYVTERKDMQRIQSSDSYRNLDHGKN
jgi:2-oxoglutarate dehydrogenase E2 component (dihydrolipoamide succinyltransferase)